MYKGTVSCSSIAFCFLSKVSRTMYVWWHVIYLPYGFHRALHCEHFESFTIVYVLISPFFYN